VGDLCRPITLIQELGDPRILLSAVDISSAANVHIPRLATPGGSHPGDRTAIARMFLCESIEIVSSVAIP
jgi:hypothetical protein